MSCVAECAVELLYLELRDEFYYFHFLGKVKKDIPEEKAKSFENLLAEFKKDLVEAIDEELKTKGESDLYCDGSFYFGPLKKLYIKKYYDIYDWHLMPMHVKVGITKDFVFDGSIPLAYKDRKYVYCSKDYALKQIDYYEHAKENGYVFDDAEDQLKDWQEFLEKFDGDFYIREDLKENVKKF